MGDPGTEGQSTSPDVNEMPPGVVSAGIGGGEMPSGQMPEDDQPGFSPISGDMPRGEMTALGGLAQMQPSAIGTAVLTEMPAGGMDAPITRPTTVAGLEMTGTFRLELLPGTFGHA